MLNQLEKRKVIVFQNLYHCFIKIHIGIQNWANQNKPKRFRKTKKTKKTAKQYGKRLWRAKNKKVRGEWEKSKTLNIKLQLGGKFCLRHEGLVKKLRVTN